MSDENKGLECVADQFGLKRLYPKSRLFAGNGTSVSDTCIRKLEIVDYSTETAEPTEPEIEASKTESCQFAVGVIFKGSENRICTVGIFCPATVFKDPKIYLGCTIRKDKLAEKKT